MMMTSMIVIMKDALLLRAGKMCAFLSFCHMLCCLLPEAEPEAFSFRADVCMCWKPCVLLISLQADMCNHDGRNLEYLQGQLEGHRLLQRNKMEIADRQVLLFYASFPLMFWSQANFYVSCSAYVLAYVRVRPCHMQLVLDELHFTYRRLRCVHIATQKQHFLRINL